MVIKVGEFVGKDVGIRHEIEGRFSMSFLHSYHIEAETIFARNFITLGKMIDFLIFIEPLILVALERAGGPKQVPLVALGVRKAVVLQDGAHHFVFEADHAVQKLRVLDVIRFLVAAAVRGTSA